MKLTFASESEEWDFMWLHGLCTRDEYVAARGEEPSDEHPDNCKWFNRAK